MSIKVKLRRKNIKGGKQSLYLDIYPPIPHPVTGKPTRREFLGTHIFKSPKSPLDKSHNKESLYIAEAQRLKREIELNKPEIYTDYEKEQLEKKRIGEMSFKDYFRRIADKRTGSSWKAWESVLIHFNNFYEDDISFGEISEIVCNEFKEYLLISAKARKGEKNLSRNTAAVYFGKFRTVLRKAYSDGYLATDWSARIKGLSQEETRRETLTLDEVNALIRTECDPPVLKKAAIFSVYTGLRHVDIQKLTWGEIEERQEGNWVINFKQQKTKGIETLPVSQEAIHLIGERGKKNEKVFKDLQYSAFYNRKLAKWVGLAGITKDITFHSFRHTYATLQLTFGTDIYTVSKLLGHKDIKTTQVYAKIVDETKRAAANKIQLDIKEWK